MENPGGPLAFSASFPPDERFMPTAADLAARVATAAGCGDAASEEVRIAVGGAFRRALTGSRPDGPSIEVSFRTSDASFDAELTCGGQGLLHCRHARSA